MKRVRALFLSDIHLGSRACQAERLLAFLKGYESEYLYLVGDIIDLWAMSRGVYWPPAHNTIVQKILRKARRHTRVIFIPGNHDEVLREYIGMSFGAVDIVSEHVHVTAAGKRLLLVHGDEYDQVTTCHHWLSVLGDVSYTALVHVNRALSWLRRKLGVSDTGRSPTSPSAMCSRPSPTSVILKARRRTPPPSAAWTASFAATSTRR